MRESIHIEIYSRQGCHLCDQAKAVVESFQGRYRLKLTVTDVDTTPALRAAYGNDIPVVTIEGAEVFRHRVDPAELERRLEALWNRSIS